MSVKKSCILILCDYFLPGFKGGGPIRSIQGIIEGLSAQYDFIVVTRDRDLAENAPYQGISSNEWIQQAKMRVIYLSPDKMGFRSLRKVINEVEYDILYLNSFFSQPFSIKPLFLRKLGMISATPVILAPRGEFAQGALNIGYIKKKIYITFARLWRLYSGVHWQASSAYEFSDILKVIGWDTHIRIASSSRVSIASDIPLYQSNEMIVRSDVKRKGSLNIVFLSRICRMKNLEYAINLLNGLEGEVLFDIYGPLEDMKYWGECKSAIETLSKNVCVKYKGSINSNLAIKVFSQYDLFLLPTQGENFGHVIAEALSGGCPVLISDQTPWRDLEALGVGWDISLGDPESFRDKLRECVEMSEDEHAKFRLRARKYASSKAADPETLNQNIKLFDLARGRF